MAKGGFLAAIKDDPATKALAQNLGSYAQARVANMGKGKSGEQTAQPQEQSQPQSNGNGNQASKGDQVEGGMLSGVGDAMSSGTSKVAGGVKGAVSGMMGRKGKAAKRPTNIFESIFIALPADEAYAAWTDYEEHAGYMKGVEKVSVEKDEETGQITSNWTAKIFWSRRSWKATTEEEIEGERVRWKTESNKGTIDGVVVFSPINEHLCLMQYVLEYRPKGFMEWTGNRWRTVGRRARLDVKHFARQQLMQDRSESEEPKSEQSEEQPEQAQPEAQQSEAQPERRPAKKQSAKKKQEPAAQRSNGHPALAR